MCGASDRRQTKILTAFCVSKTNPIVFGRGVYVAENTSHPASVRVVRLKRTASARSGVYKLVDKVSRTLSMI